MGIFQVYNRIVELSGSDMISLNVSMKDYTSFKIGGHAGAMIYPTNMGEVLHAVSVCKNYDVDYFIMGNGSNLLVKDDGYNGVIINLGEKYNQVSVKENKVTASAGALLKDVAEIANEYCLTGMEFACGIPGTIGGAVFMNAGAYDGEMKNIVESVKVLGRTCEITVLEQDEMHFGYRTSSFQSGEDIILEVTLDLQEGKYEAIKAKIDDFSCKREDKQPLSYPSAGSVFKRPEGYFAGKLITDAGLKGMQVGGAKVSEKHAGFIVNEGDATAQDVIDLIKLVQETVMDKFGVKLEQEVRILGD